MRLRHIKVENFRSLARLDLNVEGLCVLFGPNGAGKSAFLDTIRFFRDCAVRGVEAASSYRSHGIGVLWDGAEPNANIAIELLTERARYQLKLGFSAGRIEPAAGELLHVVDSDLKLIDRKAGSNKAEFYNMGLQQHLSVELREPEKLSLARYLDFDTRHPAAVEMDGVLRYVRFYNSRNFALHRLKVQGSEGSFHTVLFDRGENLWSVLRNLKDKQEVDDRVPTIIRYMKEAFPEFDGLVIEPTGPTSLYCTFLLRGLRSPLQASGVSDGHLQMLLILTALFSEGPDRYALLLLDEPEISLHPWALAVLCRAMREAQLEWSKHVVVATHSPVLISQFDPAEIMAVERVDGESRIYRATEIEGVQDLLQEYAAGSLYMAEAIAPQSKRMPSGKTTTDSGEVPE